MDEKKHILIVDDEQINLEFFDVMLSKLGFQVDKAENGLEALEAIKGKKPDLIILDNVMPKLSGWEVTRLLKSRKEYAEYADIPIIMFSAMDDVKDKVEGLELGADDYITKPFNFSEVLARIRAVLRTHELIRQIEVRESRLSLTEDIVRASVDISSDIRSRLEPLLASEGQRGTAIQEAIDQLDAWKARVDAWQSETSRLKHDETALAAIKQEIRGKAEA